MKKGKGKSPAPKAKAFGSKTEYGKVVKKTRMG